MRNVCIAVAVFAALAVTVTPARAEGGHGTFTVGYFQVKPVHCRRCRAGIPV